LILWTDGQAVYIDAPEKDAKRKSGIFRKSTAGEVRSYLKNGHVGHNLVPDVELISSMALARCVPPLAVQSIKDMRSAGMAMDAIYQAIKVHSRHTRGLATMLLQPIEHATLHAPLPDNSC
jgi:hypothetical protein